MIEDTMAQWWEQALAETVLGVLALDGSQYWSDRVISEALSEISLTAAVMQRYHPDATLRRELHGRLGIAKNAANVGLGSDGESSPPGEPTFRSASQCRACGIFLPSRMREQ